MSFYPAKILDRLWPPKHSGGVAAASAVGTAATFSCGSFIRFSLMIDPAAKSIASVKFQTNGCGFMTAVADVLAERFTGKALSDLHGLADDELRSITEAELVPFPAEREHCCSACFEAIRGAFSDYRSSQLEEFVGEKALICTCFGITVETVESLISEKKAMSVDAIADRCNAGSGCGSCRMLIQEMFDQREMEERGYR